MNLVEGAKASSIMKKKLTVGVSSDYPQCNIY